MSSIEVKQPSDKLTELIDSLALDFGKLKERVEKVFEQGRKEGFLDKEIGKMVRAKMKENYAKETIRRVLPDTAKNPKMIREFVDKKSTNQEKPDGEETDFPSKEAVQQQLAEVDETEEQEEDTNIWQINPADYNIEDLGQYDNTFRGELIEYLHSQVNVYKKKCELLASELLELKNNPQEYRAFEGKKEVSA